MNRRRLVLLLDVDGVVLDFRRMFVETASRVTGRSFDMKTVDDREWSMRRSLNLDRYENDAVWDAIKRPGVARDMNPLPGAVDAVRKLIKQTDFYFVTSPVPCETWCHDRREQLTSLFGKIAIEDRIIFAKSKHIVAGDVFVDDHESTVFKWVQHQRMIRPSARVLEGVIWKKEDQEPHLFGECHQRVDWDWLLNLVAEKTSLLNEP